MLIEIKAKVAWKIDGKIKKKNEIYLLDKEVFAQAEYDVTTMLNTYKEEGTVDYFEIQTLKLSSIKEVCSQYQGELSFIATLRENILLEDDSEKQMKYKVLLWADSISQAMANTREIVSQGYDMQIDSLKEVNYTYLTQ